MSDPIAAEKSESIYKILPRLDWERIRESREWAGSGQDFRDGFIHFSTREQLPGTLARHFGGQNDLVVLQVSASCVGNALRWELSRDGQLFPHLYGPLVLNCVVQVSSSDQIGQLNP